jgi:hypothetical protein
MEMAGMLFYVKSFRFNWQILLEVSVIDNVADVWPSVPIAVANHKIKRMKQDVSMREPIWSK